MNDNQRPGTVHTADELIQDAQETARNCEGLGHLNAMADTAGHALLPVFRGSGPGAANASVAFAARMYSTVAIIQPHAMDKAKWMKLCSDTFDAMEGYQRAVLKGDNT